MIENAISSAFRRAVSVTPISRSLRSMVLRNLAKGGGLTKEGRGWDAKLSFRTYQALKKQGVVQ